jgi:hypothetical protein
MKLIAAEEEFVAAHTTPPESPAQLP